MVADDWFSFSYFDRHIFASILKSPRVDNQVSTTKEKNKKKRILQIIGGNNTNNSTN